MSIRRLIRKIESYLFGVRLHAYESRIHGTLEVWLVNGKLVLNSPNANQSYDSLHEIFRYCFEQIDLDRQPVHHVLLLGLGVGSIPSILEEELMMNCMVTAVEKDEMMLRIGKEHFNTGRFRHLRIVQDDALHFVSGCTSRFELIIIDVFADDHVPEPFAHASFLDELTGLMDKEGILLFNFITKNWQQKQQYSNVKKYFRLKEGNVKVFAPIPENKVICWQKG